MVGAQEMKQRKSGPPVIGRLICIRGATLTTTPHMFFLQKIKSMMTLYQIEVRERSQCQLSFGQQPQCFPPFPRRLFLSQLWRESERSWALRTLGGDLTWGIWVPKVQWVVVFHWFSMGFWYQHCHFPLIFHRFSIVFSPGIWNWLPWCISYHGWSPIHHLKSRPTHIFCGSWDLKRGVFFWTLEWWGTWNWNETQLSIWLVIWSSASQWF